MNLSRVLVLVAIGLFLAVAFNDAKPQRHGRGRFGSSEEDSGERRRRGPPLIACSLNDVTDEEHTCPEGIECDQGPLLLSVDVEGVTQEQSIKFCNLPPKPEKEDVCKITEADGSDVVPPPGRSAPDLAECEGDETCQYGPYEGCDGRQLYTCSEVPSVNYVQVAEEKLRSRACKIGDELQERGCRHNQSCEGMKVTVNGTELTFCPKPDFREEEGGPDEEEEGDQEAKTALDLFNRRHHGHPPRGGPGCEGHHGHGGRRGGRPRGGPGGRPRGGPGGRPRGGPGGRPGGRPRGGGPGQ